MTGPLGDRWRRLPATPPLHTLPLDELLAKLHELTNVQVVEDKASPTGHKVEIGPFPGWQTASTW